MRVTPLFMLCSILFVNFCFGQVDISYAFDSEPPSSLLSQNKEVVYLPNVPNHLFFVGSTNHEGVDAPAVIKMSANGNTIWDMAIADAANYTAGTNSVYSICHDGSFIYASAQTTRVSLGLKKEVIKLHPNTGAIIWRTEFTTDFVAEIRDIFDFNSNSILLNYVVASTERYAVISKSTGAVTATFNKTMATGDLVGISSSVYYTSSDTVYKKTPNGTNLTTNWATEIQGMSYLYDIIDLGTEIALLGRVSANNEERINFINKSTGALTGSINTGRIQNAAMHHVLKNNKLYVAWTTTGSQGNPEVYTYDCFDMITKQMVWQKTYVLADPVLSSSGDARRIALDNNNNLYILGEVFTTTNKHAVVKCNATTGDYINHQLLQPSGTPVSNAFNHNEIFVIGNGLLIFGNYNHAYKSGGYKSALSLIKVNVQNTSHSLVRKFGGTYQLDSQSTVILEGPDNKVAVASAEGRYGLIRIYDENNDVIAQKYLRLNLNLIPRKLKALPNGNFLMAGISYTSTETGGDVPNLNNGNFALYEFDWSANQINYLAGSLNVSNGGIAVYDLITDGTNHCVTVENTGSGTVSFYRTSNWTNWNSASLSFTTPTSNPETIMSTLYTDTQFIVYGPSTSFAMRRVNKSNLAFTNFQLAGNPNMGMARVEKVITTNNPDHFYYGGYASEATTYARVCSYQPSTSDTLWSRSINATNFFDVIPNADTTVLYMLYYQQGYRLAAINAADGALLWSSTNIQSCTSCSAGAFYFDTSSNNLWLSINTTSTSDVNGSSNLYEINTSGQIISTTLLDNSGTGLNAIHDIKRANDGRFIYSGSTNHPAYKETAFVSFTNLPTENLVGDFDNDGFIDADDLNLLNQNIGCTTMQCMIYDLNNDGVISVQDLILLLEL